MVDWQIYNNHIHTYSNVRGNYETWTIFYVVALHNHEVSGSSQVIKRKKKTTLISILTILLKLLIVGMGLINMIFIQFLIHSRASKMGLWDTYPTSIVAVIDTCPTVDPKHYE